MDKILEDPTSNKQITKPYIVSHLSLKNVGILKE